MRVVLVQSPYKDGDNSIPVGLLSLGSYIKERGYKPIIIDFNLHFKKISTPSFFNQAAKEILKHHPQIIGFSVMCSTLPATLLIAKECKKMAAQIPVIFGGPDVAFEEVELLNVFKQIDVVVRGEGEVTLVEVLKAIERKQDLFGILGITYRNQNNVIRNPDRPFIEDLDDLPFLDYSILPHLEEYQVIRIEAGRGCPFQCTFCSTCKMWKREFRMKSPQRLVQEMKVASDYFKKRGNCDFSILHDHFFAARKWIEEFISLIDGNNFVWSCSSRLDALDKNLIKNITKAGCKGIFLGIESGSSEIQKKIKKNLPLAELPQIIKMFCQDDRQVVLSFIIGFPGENKSQLNQTLLTALRSKLYSFSLRVVINLLSFVKGSELYQVYKRKLGYGATLQTISSPFSTKLPAELSLIKKYPLLFPSFFHIKNGPLNSETLHKYSILFNYLIDFFSITTMLLLEWFEVAPVQLGKKIIEYFESVGVRWDFSFLERAYFNQYFPFFRDFIQKNSNALIKEVFKHEELFQRSSFIYNHSFPKFKLNLNSRPTVFKGVKIRVYKYDIFRIIDNLKNNSKEIIPSTECFLAYVPGKIAKVCELDPFSFHLLSVSNGEASIQEIIQQISDQEVSYKITKKLVIKKFQFLQKQGMISVT